MTQILHNDSKSNKDLIYLMSILIVILLLLAGCASKVVTPLDTVFSSYHTIQFSSPLLLPGDQEITNPDDAHSLVLFALNLHQKKKYRQAASFFLNAADLGPKGSNRNHFRLACLEAAATSLLQGGDWETFHMIIDMIRSEMTGLQRANLSDEVCLLMGISDKLRGNRLTFNCNIPYNIENLFE